jgi:hypothetical protein
MKAIKPIFFKRYIGKDEIVDITTEEKKILEKTSFYEKKTILFYKI